jgi:hypothetical protein
MTSLYITGDRHFVDTLNYCLLRCRFAQPNRAMRRTNRRSGTRCIPDGNFLKTGATAAAASLLPSYPVLSSPLRASIATLAGSVDQPGNIKHARRLSDGWEFLQGSPSHRPPRWGADSHAGRHSENADKVLSPIATGPWHRRARPRLPQPAEARLASRKMATGPKPTPATSSTGISKPSRRCLG